MESDQAPLPSPRPRRRWLRWVLGGVAVLLLLPPLALGAVWLTLDTETLKPRIAAAVEAATGRRLTLAGAITLRPALVPTIAIEDVALANAPGGSAPEMLTARRIEVELALVPLLSRQVDIRRLAVIEPRLLLETDAAGRPNWVFAPVRAAPAPGAAPATPAVAQPRVETALVIQALSLNEGVLTWRDGARGTSRVLAIERMAVAATATGLRHEARLSLDGQAIRVEGETGGIGAALPLPVDLTFRAGEAVARVAGRYAPGAGEWAVTASIPDLAALSGVAGVALPALREVSASVRVVLAEAGVVRLQALELGGPGGRLTGDLAVAMGPRLRVSGRLASEGIDLVALRASPGPGMAAALPVPVPVPVGGGAVPPAGGPQAGGASAGGGAPAGGGASAGSVPSASGGAAGSGAGAAGAGGRRVIPDLPLRLAGLAAMDAEVALSLASLRVSPTLTLGPVAAQVTLIGGALTLDPLTMTLPGGAVAANLTIEGAASPPRLRLALRTAGAGVELGALQRALGQVPMATGPVQAIIALAGVGADTRALAASLEGSIALAMADGRIARAALAPVPPELLRILLPQGVPAEGLALECFALRLPARGGVLRVESFLVQSALGRLGMTGTMNLGNEAIDLRLLPDLRSGIFNLRAPVNLGGTLAAPRVARMDATSAAAAGLTAFLGTQRTPDRTLEALADTLAHGTPALSDCATALAVARGERPPPAANSVVAPAPAAPPVRAPNAGDVLRGLLGGGRR